MNNALINIILYIFYICIWIQLSLSFSEDTQVETWNPVKSARKYLCPCLYEGWIFVSYSILARDSQLTALNSDLLILSHGICLTSISSNIPQSITRFPASVTKPVLSLSISFVFFPLNETLIHLVIQVRNLEWSFCFFLPWIFISKLSPRLMDFIHSITCIQIWGNFIGKPSHSF